MEFHVHIDALNLAIKAMLVQNPIKKCDQPIAYTSKLLNNAKENYTNIKREVLATVYVLHKFRHYLLGNQFVLYVDHMALSYFVKKPQLLGQIARWLLLFLKYDFSMVYKPRHSHPMAAILLQLPNVTKNLGIFEKTIDASLLIFQPK